MGQPRSRALMAVLAALVMVSGCGGLNVGYAAQVGQEKISRKTLRDVVDARCRLQRSTPGAPPVAFSTLNQETLTVMMQSQLGLQFGQSRHASYDRAELAGQMRAVAAEARPLPPDERRLYVDTVREAIMSRLMLRDLGTKALERQGQRAPSADLAMNLGARMLVQWAKNVKIDVDPRYDNGMDTTAGGGGSLSLPTSREAMQAGRGSSNPNYLQSLPASQVCG